MSTSGIRTNQRSASINQAGSSIGPALNQDEPHPVLNAELKKLKSPISKEALLKAFESVMPVTDESFMPVQNALFDFSDRQTEFGSGTMDVHVGLITTSSAKLVNAKFRHESLESAAETGQGITKKELVGFLRHGYAAGDKLSFMDSLHLRDSVRSKQFARDKTAKLAKAIWNKEMTAAQAGSLLGHRF